MSQENNTDLSIIEDANARRYNKSKNEQYERQIRKIKNDFIEFQKNIMKELKRQEQLMTNWI